MNIQWSDSKKQKAFTLRAKGLTFSQIADKMNVPHSTIYNWVKKAIATHPRKYKALKTPNKS